VLVVGGLPLLILGLLTLYIYVDSTGILVSYDNYVFQKRLRAKVDSGQNDFLLKEITDFKWNEVCFYLPYEYNYLNSNSYIEEGDGLYNIEFKHSDKITLLTRINRNLLHEESIKQWPARCFTREAKLYVVNKKILNIKNAG
jgi:hypothetical protein